MELTKNPDAMITALRKIEGRGELPGATSAVMELCVDNPREGFADLFATHPSVQSRIEKLVQFAGGRDSGPLALPEDASADPAEAQAPSSSDQPPPLPHRAKLWRRWQKKSRQRCPDCRMRGASLNLALDSPEGRSLKAGGVETRRLRTMAYWAPDQDIK